MKCFKVFFLICIQSFFLSSLFAVENIIGYGAGTTGGEGGEVITVTTFSQLKNAAQTPNTPMVIKVSGALSGSGIIYVESNKSIIGLTGSSVTGAAFSIYDRNNVIIQRMTIKNVRTYSNITIKNDSHHVWIDHNELSSELIPGDREWTYYDGLLDVGNRSDFVTLSWNILHDSHIPMLIGFGDYNYDDANFLRVTVHNNFFYNSTERQPKARFGRVHIFNNYVLGGNSLNSGGYALGSTCEARIRTDNNYFENLSLPIDTDHDARPGFIGGVETNIFKNSGSNQISTAPISWRPEYEYQSVLVPASEVPALVLKGAGPKGVASVPVPTPTPTPTPTPDPISSCVVLDMAKAYSDGGYAYAFYGGQGLDSSVANLRLIEGAKELGPANSKHVDIRNLGQGRFSYDGSELRLSSSDNSNPKTNGRKYQYCPGTTQVAVPVCQTINKANVVRVSGYRFSIRAAFKTTGDSSLAPTQSTLKLYENGVEIGPAHSKHSTISTYGSGRFSHWNSELFFSSSNKTNPKTNARNYKFCETP